MEEKFSHGYFGELGDSAATNSATASNESASQGENLEERREFVESVMRRRIEEMLASGENCIGKGKTAEIHMPTDSHEICLKIVTEREAVGKNLPPPRIPVTDLHPHSPETQHLGPKQEGQYLEDVINTDQNIIIPKPYAWSIYEIEDEGDTYFVKERINIILMERLDAVSLQDVILGTAELPPTMNPDQFFSSLHNFVEKMHGKGVYHRDLHAGNIMIDNKTGRPCVIDFGRSTSGTGDDAYQYEYRDGTNLRKGAYGHDEDYLDKVEKDFQSYLRTKNQTAAKEVQSL